MKPQKVGTPSTPRECLLRAAELISTRGHAKGTIEDDDGRLCLLGALQRASGPYHEAAALLRAYMEKQFGVIEPGLVPVSWNNNPKRTAEEVIGALRNAAFDCM